MVYGNQQWSTLKACDWGELTFLYHCVAMVKNRENQTAEERRQKAEAEALERQRVREREQR